MAEFEISEQDRQLLETVRKSINMGDISERDLDSFMNELQTLVKDSKTEEVLDE